MTIWQHQAHQTLKNKVIQTGQPGLALEVVVGRRGRGRRTESLYLNGRPRCLWRNVFVYSTGRVGADTLFGILRFLYIPLYTSRALSPMFPMRNYAYGLPASRTIDDRR